MVRQSDYWEWGMDTGNFLGRRRCFFGISVVYLRVMAESEVRS